MRDTVRPDHACAINGKPHGQPLDRDVVNYLVIAALQECRIDRRKRLHPLTGQAATECHRMLFRDSGIKGAIREDLAEFIQARARRHGCRNGTYPIICFRFFDQGLGKNICIAWRFWLCFFLRAAGDIEF